MVRTAVLAAWAVMHSAARTSSPFLRAAAAVVVAVAAVAVVAAAAAAAAVALAVAAVVSNPLEVAMVRHAEAARDEMKHLADEFLAVARTTAVPTPTIDRLYASFDPDAPLLPEGSAEIPLDWRGVWAVLLVLLALAVGVVFWWRKGWQR